MTLPLIRTALETALAAMSPSVATAYENAPFSPVIGTPFQAAYILLGEPDDIVIGGASHVERGIFQINLHYPLDAGAGAGEGRAQLIRQSFFRGSSFASGAVTVVIDRTPEIGPSLIEDERRVTPVRIRFTAVITRS